MSRRQFGKAPYDKSRREVRFPSQVEALARTSSRAVGVPPRKNADPELDFKSRSLGILSMNPVTQVSLRVCKEPEVGPRLVSCGSRPPSSVWWFPTLRSFVQIEAPSPDYGVDRWEDPVNPSRGWGQPLFAVHLQPVFELNALSAANHQAVIFPARMLLARSKAAFTGIV